MIIPQLGRGWTDEAFDFLVSKGTEAAKDVGRGLVSSLLRPGPVAPPPGPVGGQVSVPGGTFQAGFTPSAQAAPAGGQYYTPQQDITYMPPGAQPPAGTITASVISPPSTPIGGGCFFQVAGQNYPCTKQGWISANALARTIAARGQVPTFILTIAGQQISMRHCVMPSGQTVAPSDLTCPPGYNLTRDSAGRAVCMPVGTTTQYPAGYPSGYPQYPQGYPQARPGYPAARGGYPGYPGGVAPSGGYPSGYPGYPAAGGYPGYPAAGGYPSYPGAPGGAGAPRMAPPSGGGPGVYRAGGTGTRRHQRGGRLLGYEFGEYARGIGTRGGSTLGGPSIEILGGTSIEILGDGYSDEQRVVQNAMRQMWKSSDYPRIPPHLIRRLPPRDPYGAAMPIYPEIIQRGRPTRPLDYQPRMGAMPQRYLHPYSERPIAEGVKMGISVYKTSSQLPYLSQISTGEMLPKRAAQRSTAVTRYHQVQTTQQPYRVMAVGAQYRPTGTGSHARRPAMKTPLRGLFT